MLNGAEQGLIATKLDSLLCVHSFGSHAICPPLPWRDCVMSHKNVCMGGYQNLNAIKLLISISFVSSVNDNVGFACLKVHT